MPETCCLLSPFSCTRDDCRAWFPAWWIGAQPAGGLSHGSLFFGPHLHAPHEDPSARTVDRSLACGYTRGTSETGVEVAGVAGEYEDDAYVARLPKQAGLRRAHLDQAETFPLLVTLGEVAEQFALVVGTKPSSILPPAPTSLTEYHDH